MFPETVLLAMCASAAVMVLEFVSISQPCAVVQLLETGEKIVVPVSAMSFFGTRISGEEN